MNRIGLALSGGGFRASLYHLGLIRFLRDADILSQVTHVTSVSGGSIIAAHLLLNWDRYNGSLEEFDEVASEFLSFVDLDIRNRIVRRFPLNIPFRLPRRLLGFSNRKLTRTGLLESHYEKYLYGDTSLFELPERPKLHILTTNVSEGCLCSFNRDGLLMVRRQPGKKLRMDHIQTGLATVAMAVTSSSAFAGFFPPIELTGAEVGVSGGEFGRQAYTDGGVFDNLGVRMFHCLQSQILTETPFSRDDFFQPRAAFNLLVEAAKSSEETPLRRFAQILHEAMNRIRRCEHSDGENSKTNPPARLGFDESAIEELVLTCLSDVMKHHQFQLEPLFEDLKLVDPEAQALFRASRDYKVLDAADQLWLNRHVMEAVFRQAMGQPCLRRLNSGLDAVLVSDAGQRIRVQSTRHAGGLIRTAVRATDILMERVWELENETFQGTPGFVFAPITQVVGPDEDPTALHPEIQRHLADIRTDLDRFSKLEISSLVRHGYCVGRKVFRERRDLLGADLPWNSPWDPTSKVAEATSVVPLTWHPDELPGQPTETETQPVRVSTTRSALRILPDRRGNHLADHAGEPSPTTVKARILKASAGRRIWGTLLDPRDWISYVYVPLLVPIFILLPYFVTQYYEWTHRNVLIAEALSQGNPASEELSRLLTDGPDKPWANVRPEPPGKLDELDLAGFAILQASHTMDFRLWNPDREAHDDSSRVYIYRTLKVLKDVDRPGADIFRYRFFAGNPKAAFRFPRQALQPKLRRLCAGEQPVEGENCRWEVSVDFTRVPAGEWRDVIIASHTPGTFLERGTNSTRMIVDFPEQISQVEFWILMPREYRDWRIMRFMKEKSDSAQAIKPPSEFLGEGQILAFKLLSVKPWFSYEIFWEYK